MVDTAGIGEGNRVLINGAAGGVGHLAVQIAKARGAHVIALASAAKTDIVRSLGADKMIDYTTTDFTQTARDLDTALDVIGGDYPAKFLEVPASLARPRKTPPRATSASPPCSSKPTSSACPPSPTIAATFALAQAGAAHGTRPGLGKVVLTTVDPR